MLTEIYCEKFKTNGENGTTRDPITFSSGLNIIEGTDNGSNSIGKSTLLMIIDFCFGGKDYVDVLEDVMKNVGPHTIYFTFTFEKTYHFARKTDEKEFIYVCDTPHEIGDKKIPLDEFNKFLMNKYEINIPDITFRKVVSRFMRIANRQNLNELLPFKSFKDEKDSSAIQEMLKLYNLYEQLKELEKTSNEASKKDNALSNAQEYKWIPKINLKQYKENEKQIVKLKEQAEALADRSERGLLELPAEKAEEISKIKDQITSLKRKRSKFYNQLNSYKKDEEYEIVTFDKDFTDLTTYFNNVNIQNLNEIEEFHKKITKILKNEIKNSSQEIWNNINMLNSAIKQLEDELSSIQQTTNVSKVVLNSYASIKKEIDILEKTNYFFEEKEKLDKDVKEKEKKYNDATLQQIDLLTSRINSKMEEINRVFYINETMSPILSIPSTKRYTFTTPNDLGTGCKFKGLITFDTAVLTTTPLPVLAHDSIMFVQMSNERVERTLKLYNQINTKQIFIAVDKTINLNQEAQKIIDEHRRITLSPEGNELFGWYWGKPREDK